MDNGPNWTEFYFALQGIGPELLEGVHPGLQSWVDDQSNSDAFYSDSLCYALEEWWGEDRKKAVQETLTIWVENVRRHLREILGPGSIIPWEALGGTQQEKAELKRSIKMICIRIDDQLVNELLAAAANADVE